MADGLNTGAVKTGLRFAAASDAGRRRRNNEDRYYVDPERGVYAVIDGVGGHAAGETAAGLAVDVMRERLERPSGSPEERIREAITLANNEIFRLSKTRPEWTGMACVLTLALVEDDVVTVGHVGDSRLYLLRQGEIAGGIRKVTHDHSPVGEREDRGELEEHEAMRHPRRNEIYRDVGSCERNPDDAAFIEMATFPMPADGALLLCSDGLTDLVTSAEIRAGVERYAPDFYAAVRALIDAANEAGGKDNITIVLVAGPAYGDGPGGAPVTAARVKRRSPVKWIFLAGGIAAGLAAAWLMPLPRGSHTFTVGSDGIAAALNLAHAGDTVVIPGGRYRERIVLKQGVTLRARIPDTVTIVSPDGGPAVRASGMDAGGVDGVWIQGDADAPLSTGIEVTDASPFIYGVRITGATTGIDVQGASSPTIASSQITNNPGAGIRVAGAARIENNVIAANGKAGVEVLDSAHPLLRNNAIVDNEEDAIVTHGPYRASDFEENFFGGIPAHEAVRIVGPERPGR